MGKMEGKPSEESGMEIYLAPRRIVI
jgi:hypothetical protein